MMRYAPIPSSLYGKLQQITPSRAGGLSYYPCLVELKDGSSNERVYVIPAADYLKVWGVYPEEERGKRTILMADVVDLRESPVRLPPVFADELYAAGESGMGYCTFRVRYRNGTVRSYVTGGAVDFIPFPTGLGAADVSGVEPNQGRGDTAMSGSPYAWCLFDGVEPSL